MTLRRLAIFLLILFILANAYSVFGPARGDLATRLVPLTGLAFAFVHAAKREGWKGAALLLALVFTVSLLFESVGVATGLVYGPYHYTEKLGPRFLGLVPYLIPVAWFMMSYPSFVIAERIAPGTGRWQRILGVAAVGGLVMTAWDVIMDPLMVASGHWVWDAMGPYFGIPLQNFWGWWLTVFTTYAIYLIARGDPRPAPPAGFDGLALIAYLTVALSTILSAYRDASGGVALIGFFVMMPWVVAGWGRIVHSRQSTVDSEQQGPAGKPVEIKGG